MRGRTGPAGANQEAHPKQPVPSWQPPPRLWNNVPVSELLAVLLCVAIAGVAFLVFQLVRGVRRRRMSSAERWRATTRTVLVGLLIEVSLAWVLVGII